jgi:hypothetical protein
MASDDVEVTSVTWSNSATGGSGTATGTIYWETASISLNAGLNPITVTAQDSSGNTAMDWINVTYNPVDTIDPEIAITEPTTSSSYDTDDASLDLSGTYSDDVGVTSITWTNSRGGSGSAIFVGGSWEIAGVSLQEGDNIISVTAMDGGGNSATATLNVVYSLDGSGGSDDMDLWLMLIGIFGALMVIVIILYYLMRRRRG